MSSAGRWRRIAQLSRACAFALLLASPAFGQSLGSDYLSANQAPPSWAQFSKLVKYRFETWIAANDPVANRLRAYISQHTGALPPIIRMQVWLNLDGTVNRVSFTSLNDEQADADLQTILDRGNIGEAPPPEMLQPLNLRFSLNLKK